MHDFSHYGQEALYYLHVIINFLLEGLREGFSRVNAALGLIIALFAAYFMSEWKRIWAIALGATIILLIALWAIPILDDRASFHLPPDLLEVSYWRTALALYFGFLVIVSIFFFIKTRVLPRGKH